MQRPWISTNLAISADGKIAPDPPRPSGWTSSADHQRLLELRKSADALLVGHGTLLADRMTMTVPDQENQPLRCIVSRKGKIDFGHPLFHKQGGAIHVLVTEAMDVIAADHVTFHHISLTAFLEKLSSEMGVQHLHCEGGGELIFSLADQDLIDEFHLTLAGHTLFGGQEAKTATGVPADFLKATQGFQVDYFRHMPDTNECFLTYTRSWN